MQVSFLPNEGVLEQINDLKKNGDTLVTSKIFYDVFDPLKIVYCLLEYGIETSICISKQKAKAKCYFGNY